MKERLDIVEFGKRLIDTEDLDPLYVALCHSGLTSEELHRWLVAYWCYYHAGLCCWIVDQGPTRFWSTLAVVANGGTQYPRGTERRHFRGKLATESVDRLSEQFGDATDLINWLIEGELYAASVCRRAKSLYGFGEWVQWKVADMLERLTIAPITFTEKDLPLMFKSSRLGALEACERYGLKGDDKLVTAHRYLVRDGALGALRAPPSYDRPINVQETETIFCKWHSHLGGHYPVGKDSREIREGLLKHARCRTAQKLLRGLKKLRGEK